MRSPRRLLVANRGEIALRIFRACRDLGIETVAVFSDADRAAPHVAAADDAVRLGPAPRARVYLSVGGSSRRPRARAPALVHPGYGFLAENAGFARACREAGLTFVGPPAEAIAAMGSKTGPGLGCEAGVPVVPGNAERRGPRGDSRVRDEARLSDPAQGVGGRRRQGDADRPAEAELAPAFARGSAEAGRFIRRRRRLRGEARRSAAPRRGPGRVGDARHGSPSASASAASSGATRRSSRNARRRSSARAAGAALRGGAGGGARGRLLLLRHGRVPARARRAFYFLEMNTRLQVEHPVTEEVWGVDLAATMIAIALGERLPFSAESSPRAATPSSAASTPRIPHGFAPSPGLIAALRAAEGPGVRNDVGVEADPSCRSTTIRCSASSSSRARRAATRSPGSRGRSPTTRSAGVETTLPLFRALAADPEFRAAGFDVQWLDRRLAAGFREGARRSTTNLRRCSPPRCWREKRKSGSRRPPAGKARDGGPTRGGGACGLDQALFDSEPALMRLFRVEGGPGPEESAEMSVRLEGDRAEARIGGRRHRLELIPRADGTFVGIFESGRVLRSRITPAKGGRASEPGAATSSWGSSTPARSSRPREAPRDRARSSRRCRDG